MTFEEAQEQEYTSEHSEEAGFEQALGWDCGPAVMRRALHVLDTPIREGMDLMESLGTT